MCLEHYERNNHYYEKYNKTLIIALIDIIMENVDDYLNGQTDAQEAARLIQNRASRYIAEQS